MENYISLSSRDIQFQVVTQKYFPCPPCFASQGSCPSAWHWALWANWRATHGWRPLEMVEVQWTHVRKANTGKIRMQFSPRRWPTFLSMLEHPYRLDPSYHSSSIWHLKTNLFINTNTKLLQKPSPGPSISYFTGVHGTIQGTLAWQWVGWEHRSGGGTPMPSHVLLCLTWACPSQQAPFF